MVRGKNVAVVGGGAAGFFMAIALKQAAPDVGVTIYERSTRVLVKVGLSGGGRCNLTNSFEDVKDLKNVYPRGDKLMKRLFRVFDYKDAYDWFERHGIPLVTQDDECVFPRSQSSQSIIDCFLRLAQQLGVTVKTSHAVQRIVPLASEKGDPAYELHFKDERLVPQQFAAVVVTTGGSPKREGLRYLEELGHKTVAPVPSLFTLNIADEGLRGLMGTVVEDVQATIAGTKFRSRGALLVTHWGASGPAILKLSSYAARYMSDNQYMFELSINWANETNCEVITEDLCRLVAQNGPKQLSTLRPFGLPSRLWAYLLTKSGLPVDRKWNELGRKGINKLTNILANDTYAVSGRGTFREEFVTCGGVSLESINLNTLESKVCPNLYFAGEVLDVDAVTGGFNLQAAWTTGYVVAQSVAARLVDERPPF